MRSPKLFPGVYRLEHLPTGAFYVGSSMCLHCRFYSWCCRAHHGWHYAGRRFGQVRRTLPGEWRFVVVERLEGASADAVFQAELREIERAMGRVGCLNSRGRKRGSLGALEHFCTRPAGFDLVEAVSVFRAPPGPALVIDWDAMKRRKSFRSRR